MYSNRVDSWRYKEFDVIGFSHREIARCIVSDLNKVELTDKQWQFYLTHGAFPVPVKTFRLLYSIIIITIQPTTSTCKNPSLFKCYFFVWIFGFTWLDLHLFSSTHFCSHFENILFWSLTFDTFLLNMNVHQFYFNFCVILKINFHQKFNCF